LEHFSNTLQPNRLKLDLLKKGDSFGITPILEDSISILAIPLTYPKPFLSPTLTILLSYPSIIRKLKPKEKA